MQIQIDNFLVNMQVKKDGKKEYYYLEDFGFIRDSNYAPITTKLFDVLDFIELLKAWVGNKLNVENSYKIANLEAKQTNKTKENFLRISFDFGEVLFLDKFQCMKLSSKLQKVLNKVEIFG